ncbi:hypothetical protein [Roseovarius sp. 2305UL8-3]|uniref:hypothetical protein n=1 Tax=Roseovarius conchicola TaxID=3121636 RepID=UPI0035291D4A
MIRPEHILAVLVFGAFTTQASAQSAPIFITDTMVFECVKETRAPGRYEWLQVENLIEIQAIETGTARGANDVNDCLQDKLQIQYGSAALTKAAAGSPGTVTGVGCRNATATLMAGNIYCIGRR